MFGVFLIYPFQRTPFQWTVYGASLRRVSAARPVAGETWNRPGQCLNQPKTEGRNALVRVPQQNPATQALAPKVTPKVRLLQHILLKQRLICNFFSACNKGSTLVKDKDSFNGQWSAKNALKDAGLAYWVGRWGGHLWDKGPNRNVPRSFTFDLGCTREITEVHLRNSYGRDGNE